MTTMINLKDLLSKVRAEHPDCLSSSQMTEYLSAEVKKPGNEAYAEYCIFVTCWEVVWLGEDHHREREAKR
jgi:hypothetical protein